MASLYRSADYNALITNLIILNDKGFSVRLPRIDSNNNHVLTVNFDAKTAVLVIK